MYAQASEAQGMTLADLLAKQSAEEADHTVSKICVSLLMDLSEDICVFNADGHVHALVNDTDSLVALTYNGTTKKTLEAHTSLIIVNEITSVKLDGKVANCFITNDWDKVTGLYYAVFGLSHVVLPSSASVYLPAIWGRVCTRVNEKFWKRFLAGETLEEWQVLLQTLTDELAPRYERAFRMYANNSEASEADILATMTTDYGGDDGVTEEMKQTKAATSKSTVRDTPDGAVNDSTNFAGSVTDGTSDSGTTLNTRKGKVTVTQTGEGGIIGRVNDNIRLWRDLETDLVSEYAKAFMSFIWA